MFLDARVGVNKSWSSISCDGRYLYLHCTGSGLYKVGSGYGGTLKGHVYLHQPDFHKKEQGWLAFCQVNRVILIHSIEVSEFHLKSQIILRKPGQENIGKSL